MIRCLHLPAKIFYPTPVKAPESRSQESRSAGAADHPGLAVYLPLYVTGRNIYFIYKILKLLTRP